MIMRVWVWFWRHRWAHREKLDELGYCVRCD